jgi:transcription elongation factor GreA
MSERFPMTPTGYQKVFTELKHCKEVVRPQIVRDIEEARAHGDISENSEYEDAKERQAQMEGKIAELESRLSRADIIDINTIPPSNVVIFGTTVEVEDVDTGDTIKYRLVGTEEVDVKAGLLSYTSPIGRALIGKKVGMEVQFETPRGTRTVVINAVHYRT